MTILGTDFKSVSGSIYHTNNNITLTPEFEHTSKLIWIEVDQTHIQWMVKEMMNKCKCCNWNVPIFFWHWHIFVTKMQPVLIKDSSSYMSPSKIGQTTITRHEIQKYNDQLSSILSMILIKIIQPVVYIYWALHKFWNLKSKAVFFTYQCQRYNVKIYETDMKLTIRVLLQLLFVFISWINWTLCSLSE